MAVRDFPRTFSDSTAKWSWTNAGFIGRAWCEFLLDTCREGLSQSALLGKEDRLEQFPRGWGLKKRMVGGSSSWYEILRPVIVITNGSGNETEFGKTQPVSQGNHPFMTGDFIPKRDNHLICCIVADFEQTVRSCPMRCGTDRWCYDQHRVKIVP